MSCLRILPSRSLVIVFYLLITHVVHAGKPPPLTAAACEAALIVTPTEMNFGSYVGGTSGTIIMDVATGNMSYSGVTPVGSTVGVPAAFDLTTTIAQCKNKDVIFTMPASFDMINGGSMVTIDLLTNDLPGATFTVGNAYTIMMAGRLNAGVADITGTYNGSFDVTFTYVPF